eukprot:361027-Chlamydomonas_euryale.AAC.3
MFARRTAAGSKHQACPRLSPNLSTRSPHALAFAEPARLLRPRSSQTPPTLHALACPAPPLIVPAACQPKSFPTPARPSPTPSCARSVTERARAAKLAPFLAAGFRCAAAVMLIDDEELCVRQKQQYMLEGKVRAPDA